MTRTTLLLLSLLSIAELLCAQENEVSSNSEKTFGVPGLIIRRQYEISLGRGDRFILSLSDPGSLERLRNVDSLLQVFMQDMVPFRDSLADPLSSKRVDYVTDLSGNKKIRFRQTRPGGSNGGSSFLLRNGTLSALKMEQDTIQLSGYLDGPARSGSPAGTGRPWYRITWYLNQAGDLPGYVDGRLNRKIGEILARHGGRNWMPMKDGNLYYLMADSSIQVQRTGGPYFRTHSYLGLILTASVQNYKNYFVPSMGLGLKTILNNGVSDHQIGLYWEPQYFFTAGQGPDKRTSFRNDFVTLYYSYSWKDGINRPSAAFFNPYLSFSYLVHREGEFYDKNSYRLGLGRTSFLNGRVTLEPQLNFRDFFRDVTPGLKLSATWFF